MKNIHGLNRDPSPNVKYAIRKDDFFGCVHCGLGIYEYEHIDPEFKDAEKHDPKKMALLCPTEHAKVTRQFTSKETVWKWKKDPWSKRHGHCHDKFDITNDKLEI